MEMPAHEFIARVLGKMLEAGHDGCVREGGLALRYDELPQALWTTFRDVLGIRDDDGTREVLQRAARWDAKNPRLEFTPDMERKRREADPALRSLVERWAGNAYRAIEAQRLAHPLRTHCLEP